MTHDPREALEIVQQMIRGKPMEAWITDIRTMKSLGDVVQEALTASPGEQKPVAWRFELACSRAWENGEPVGWSDWEWRISETKPNAGEAMRNVTPLYLSPPPAAADETGWLIEMGDPPVYAVLSNDPDEHWTSDAGNALRFARREDAQAYSDHIGWTSPPVRVVEHMWPAAVESNASVEAIELAYGLLWVVNCDRSTRGGNALYLARKALLEQLDRAGQGRGISAARKVLKDEEAGCGGIGYSVSGRVCSDLDGRTSSRSGDTGACDPASGGVASLHNDGHPEGAARPDGLSVEARLREAVTPSAATKAAYIGEFHFFIDDRNEDGEECTRMVTVPWTTTKEIMKAILDRALSAAGDEAKKSESRAKATEGKAGNAEGPPLVRQTTTGTGLRVGVADAVQPATSEIMDATAGRDRQPSDPTADRREIVALGDLVTVNELAPYFGDWRGVTLKVVGLRLTPDGEEWASVIEGDQRHRGNGQYDGETDGFNVQWLSKCAALDGGK